MWVLCTQKYTWLWGVWHVIGRGSQIVVYFEVCICGAELCCMRIILLSVCLYMCICLISKHRHHICQRNMYKYIAKLRDAYVATIICLTVVCCTYNSRIEISTFSCIGTAYIYTILIILNFFRLPYSSIKFMLTVQEGELFLRYIWNTLIRSHAKSVFEGLGSLNKDICSRKCSNKVFLWLYQNDRHT